MQLTSSHRKLRHCFQLVRGYRARQNRQIEGLLAILGSICITRRPRACAVLGIIPRAVHEKTEHVHMYTAIQALHSNHVDSRLGAHQTLTHTKGLEAGTIMQLPVCESQRVAQSAQHGCTCPPSSGTAVMPANSTTSSVLSTVLSRDHAVMQQDLQIGSMGSVLSWQLHQFLSSESLKMSSFVCELTPTMLSWPAGCDCIQCLHMSLEPFHGELVKRCKVLCNSQFSDQPGVVLLYGCHQFLGLLALCFHLFICLHSPPTPQLAERCQWPTCHTLAQVIDTIQPGDLVLQELFGAAAIANLQLRTLHVCLQEHPMPALKVHSKQMPSIL